VMRSSNSIPMAPGPVNYVVETKHRANALHKGRIG
jgi:hypothetical protein